MSEYSPVNNVKEGAVYPSCLLTGGLHDPRVQYWEPSKMAAELRHKMDTEKSGDICLKVRELTVREYEREIASNTDNTLSQ